MSYEAIQKNIIAALVLSHGIKRPEHFVEMLICLIELVLLDQHRLRLIIQ
ncbi:hypothetical protein PPUN15366_00920 [Pseudomonas putida]|nr:hypothetical protein PPUN15366_00920 [Pseudomonas putida]